MIWEQRAASEYPTMESVVTTLTKGNPLLMATVEARAAKVWEKLEGDKHDGTLPTTQRACQ